MLEHLGAVLREARLAAGLRQIDIATVAGVGHVTLSRLERGVRWPEGLDSVIGAYAQETGRDPADLWAAALERWRATR